MDGAVHHAIVTRTGDGLALWFSFNSYHDKGRVRVSYYAQALKNVEADKVSVALGYALYVTACRAHGETPKSEADAFKSHSRSAEFVGGWEIERHGTAKLYYGLTVSDPVKLAKIIKFFADLNGAPTGAETEQGEG